LETVLRSKKNVAEQMAPIFGTQYRMTNYLERQSPKVNIIIAWLLLFLGSLEYQLNPFFKDETSNKGRPKDSKKINYKSSAYYES
jgi:hypothetical protein